uniref:Uncharacterized protein n=1 Tax=Parascaris univalens TaxID=6257 RepID=A0A915A3I7_PARUN
MTAAKHSQEWVNAVNAHSRFLLCLLEFKLGLNHGLILGLEFGLILDLSPRPELGLVSDFKARVRLHLRKCTFTCAYVYVYVFARVRLRVRTFTFMRTYVHVYARVDSRARMCTCRHVHVYVYVYVESIERIDAEVIRELWKLTCDAGVYVIRKKDYN